MGRRIKHYLMRQQALIEGKEEVTMFTNKNRIQPFENKVWLASPTMHGNEMKYVTEAYETNWMSTVGANINEVEKVAAEKAGVKYAVALSCCTAALHLCVKLAGERLYGKPAIGHGAVEGKRVFCSDMTFDATLNPVVYEGGIPVFIDTEYDSWNMDPVALEKAFEMYPEVKLVVSAELYGFPGDIKRIKEICEKHGALLIEDAAEAMGATWDGEQCGTFGDYSAISYNGNKIITGSSGGCLLTNNIEDANRVRKWSTQARENAPWYQHEEVGYNYRMSNVIAGVMVLGKNDEYRKMFSMCMFVFSSVALGGITAFSLVSKELLTLLGSNTSLPIGMFCFMGLYMYLEHNHGQYTSYFTMRNEIIYLKAYVISSLCIVLGSWILAVCGMNIYVLMLVHFVVQICFNNWYWPHRAMKLMNTNVIKTAQEGAVETWGLLKKLLRI